MGGVISRERVAKATISSEEDEESTQSTKPSTIQMTTTSKYGDRLVRAAKERNWAVVIKLLNEFDETLEVEALQRAVDATDMESGRSVLMFAAMEV